MTRNRTPLIQRRFRLRPSRFTMLAPAAYCLLPAVLAAACQTPQTQPATATPALSADLEAVLERIERADQNLRDIQATLKYSVLQLIKANPDDPDAVENKHGLIRFIKLPEPSKFFVHFEKTDDGKKVNPDKRQWIVFDGVWLIDASESGRSVTRHQMVRPGEKTDVFDLGRGSFPLPFGQSKADILEHFEVSLMPHGSDDPGATDRLLCIPKPNSQIAQRYEKVELFISNAAGNLSGLPIKVIAHNKKDVTRETIVFDQVRTNAGLDPAKDFQLPAETRKWDVEEVPLPSG